MHKQFKVLASPPPPFWLLSLLLQNCSLGSQCIVCDAEAKNLDECWECGAFSCRPCTYWCTYCPKDKWKYKICKICKESGSFLHRSSKKVWACNKCRRDAQWISIPLLVLRISREESFLGYPPWSWEDNLFLFFIRVFCDEDSFVDVRKIVPYS